MMCKHRAYGDGHCAEMPCWNYFSKCPKHAYSGDREARCSQEDHVANQVGEGESVSDPLVKWDTPLVSSSLAEIATKNPVGEQVTTAAEDIQQYVEGSYFASLADQAINEMYVEAERYRLTPRQIDTIRHTIIGRALLYVAEQELIQAAGLVDD